VDAEAAAAAGGAAANAAAAPVAPVAPKSRTYVVQKGDTLGKVAQEVYGQASRWTDIRDANKAALKGGIALKVGQELVIPE
ncbi:LysM peptidoglycan-binding domain-containing protein, partial [Myxococcota bacterium]|nr:LysM peptidoglycan-binding domain-containing protein [Myxococcota bacterium]